MRFLLDTNVVSNSAKATPSSHLIAWLARQRDDTLCISAMTLAEIRRGVLTSPAGKKRDRYEAWFSSPEGPEILFAGRILPFDHSAALIWARLIADGVASGRPRSPIDMIIAATAEANACVIVTDNERDFAGLHFINPMRV